MKRILTTAIITALFGLLLAAGTALADQERRTGMDVIPMQYMSAEIATRIFGGQIVPPSQIQGQRAFTNRGGVGRQYDRGIQGRGYDRSPQGSHRSGPSIGGGFDRSHQSDRGFDSGGGLFDRDRTSRDRQPAPWR